MNYILNELLEPNPFAGVASPATVESEIARELKPAETKLDPGAAQPIFNFPETPTKVAEPSQSSNASNATGPRPDFTPTGRHRKNCPCQPCVERRAALSLEDLALRSGQPYTGPSKSVVPNQSIQFDESTARDLVGAAISFFDEFGQKIQRTIVYGALKDSELADKAAESARMTEGTKTVLTSSGTRLMRKYAMNLQYADEIIFGVTAGAWMLGNYLTIRQTLAIKAANDKAAKHQ